MQLTILSGLIGIGLSASNYYIGEFTSYGTSTVVLNWAYPVDMCARNNNGVTSVKYWCAEDDMSITEFMYSDTACMMQTSNQTWTTMGTPGAKGSWKCDGNNNYATMELYFDDVCYGYNNIAGNPYLKQHYAPEVCYQTTTPGVSARITCDDDMLSADVYYTISSCVGTALGNSANATDMCGYYTTSAGVTVYGKVTECMTDSVTWTTTTTTTMESTTTTMASTTTTTMASTTGEPTSGGEMMKMMGTIALFIMINAVLLL